MNRVNIGSSNQLVPGVQRTYTGITSPAVYRFTANVNYLSTGGGGGIGSFSAGLDPEMSSLVTTVQDSLIITGIVNGVSTRLAGLRYNTGSSFLASLTFTAPSGTTSIKAEFLPGNTSLPVGYGYYVDNLRLARMTGTGFYTSDFVTGTIVSQNTDGWSTNWATSYMNVLTGSPNKLRVSGESPNISRNFTVTSNDACAFSYTQSENNSVSLIIEQSPNGTSGWSTLMNITSVNGTHVRNFTPTQAYVRVRMSGSLAFSLADVTLKSTHVDMMIVEIPGKGGYRYGYQGSERDDEVKGDGNSYTTEFRMLDPRLGRWLSIDPMADKLPWQSPYCSMDNNPIWFNDPQGLVAGVGDPPPGEKSGKGDKGAWAKYTKAGKNDNFVRVLAPNGTWVEFKRAKSSFTYSDGKMSEEQIKKAGVWSITNSDGQFLWDNVAGKYVKNTSGSEPSQNGPPGRLGTTTYAGGNNPKGYSQPSQNLADQAGKVHDQDYDAKRLAGAGGVVSPNSFQANIKIMKSCTKVMIGYHRGATDPYTGAKISPLTYKLAHDMYLEFSGVETLKTPTNIGYLGYKVTKDALYNTFVKPFSSIPSFVPQF